MTIKYTVETLRAGQPRPYADSEYEYVVKIEADGYGKSVGVFEPWVMFGNVENSIRRDEAARKAGMMFGGASPEQMRKDQRDWAKKIVRALCRDFRETDDADGREGAVAYFYPTLKSLSVNAEKGEVRALIISPYTD